MSNITRIEADAREVLGIGPDQPLPPALTTGQAALIVGQKPSTLAWWRYINKGPEYTKIGSAIRYRWRDLAAFIEAHTHRGMNNA